MHIRRTACRLRACRVRTLVGYIGAFAGCCLILVVHCVSFFSYYVYVSLCIYFIFVFWGSVYVFGSFLVSVCGLFVICMVRG